MMSLATGKKSPRRIKERSNSLIHSAFLKAVRTKKRKSYPSENTPRKLCFIAQMSWFNILKFSQSKLSYFYSSSQVIQYSFWKTEIVVAKGHLFLYKVPIFGLLHPPTHTGYKGLYCSQNSRNNLSPHHFRLPRISRSFSGKFSKEIRSKYFFLSLSLPALLKTASQTWKSSINCYERTTVGPRPRIRLVSTLRTRPCHLEVSEKRIAFMTHLAPSRKLGYVLNHFLFEISVNSVMKESLFLLCHTKKNSQEKQLKNCCLLCKLHLKSFFEMPQHTEILQKLLNTCCKGLIGTCSFKATSTFLFHWNFLLEPFHWYPHVLFLSTFLLAPSDPMAFTPIFALGSS